MFADGRIVRPEALCQCFVDDGNKLSPVAIIFGKESSASQRDLQSTKLAWSGVAASRAPHGVAGVRSPAFDVKISTIETVGHGERGNDAGGLDAGHFRNGSLKVLVERKRLRDSRIGKFGQRNVGYEHVSGTEAEF